MPYLYRALWDIFFAYYSAITIFWIIFMYSITTPTLSIATNIPLASYTPSQSLPLSTSFSPYFLRLVRNARKTIEMDALHRENLSTYPISQIEQG